MAIPYGYSLWLLPMATAYAYLLTMAAYGPGTRATTQGGSGLRVVVGVGAVTRPDLEHTTQAELAACDGRVRVVEVIIAHGTPHAPVLHL